MTDGGQAFPSYRQEYDGYGGTTHQFEWGMSLRDYFAAQAMCGDFASQSEETGEWSNDTKTSTLRERAIFYYRMADTMLFARNQQQKGD